MPAAHRDSDLRSCSATTVVSNQSTVFVNGKLWAVAGDMNTHGHGELINSSTGVFINGKPVVVNTPDTSYPDDSNHSTSPTAQGSDNVFCYG